MKEELLKPARRSAREQIARLADAGSFREINAVLPSVDPLHFPGGGIDRESCGAAMSLYADRHGACFPDGDDGLRGGGKNRPGL